MLLIMNKPHCFSEKDDLTINELFDFCSTEKLSMLMGVNVKSIIKRKQYLDSNNIKTTSNYRIV